MTKHVTETAAAPSELAIKHFQDMLAFETDCWDVHESLKSANPDFIVVDVRGPSAFGKGHVKGAINIPHREMTATRMAEYPKDKVFVVYCAGPHCNGANKAALRLARLGLPVKMMIGGVTGWIDEGFTFDPVVTLAVATGVHYEFWARCVGDDRRSHRPRPANCTKLSRAAARRWSSKTSSATSMLSAPRLRGV
jgi:rhodanese-related sulfurtransferase